MTFSSDHSTPVAEASASFRTYTQQRIAHHGGTQSLAEPRPISHWESAVAAETPDSTLSRENECQASRRARQDIFERIEKARERRQRSSASRRSVTFPPKRKYEPVSETYATPPAWYKPSAVRNPQTNQHIIMWDHEPLPNRPRKRRADSETSSEASERADRPADVYSHTELLQSELAGESDWTDRFVTVNPFRRTVYVTYHASTAMELHQHLWLLCCAEPDRWYTWIGSDAREQLRETKCDKDRKMVHSDYIHLMPSVSHASPQAWDCPRICASQALITPDTHDLSSSCQVDVEQCALQSERATAPLNSIEGVETTLLDRGTTAQRQELIYYSVVQSFQDGEDTAHNGRPIYRLQVTGSRAAAAANAFYDAGAHGWSTVFVCAIPRDVDLLELWQACDATVS